jgi:signal transduction histidine kinase
MVEDEGPGVPAELCTTIFDPYMQVKDVQVGGGRHAPQAGVGLGLAISKEIVEQHKGTIGVRLRETGGSAFWFRIPMRAQTNSAKVINFPGIRAAN